MSRYDSDNFDDFFNNTSDNVRGGYEPPASGRYSQSAHVNQRKRIDVDYSYDNSEIYGDEEYYDDNDIDDYNEYDEDCDDYDDTEAEELNGRASRNSDNRNSSRDNGSRRSEERKMRNKIKKSKNLGLIITTIQLILSLVFMGFLYINKKTLIFTYGLKLNLIVGSVLLVLYLIPLFMQFRRLSAKLFGKILSILISIILVVSMVLYGTVVNQLLNLGGDKEVSVNEPFIVYLSGTDSLGELSKEGNGRSDTNILAVVNPTTSTILLLTTPRDSYLELLADDIPAGNYDKLTHAGLYGTGKKDSDGNWEHGYDVSMNMLSELYDINISPDQYHYARINFTGFMDLVDAVGGVDIDVPQAFSRYEFDQTFTFEEGLMHMDGIHALTFVRERKSFANGDFQRGQNQTLFIKSMIKQAVSTNTIKNYKDIVSAIDTSFETDLSPASLARLQTSLMNQGKGNWNIVNYATAGYPGGEYMYCYTMDKYLSVVVLDDDSIKVSQKLIQMVLDGDEVTDSTAEQIAAEMQNEAQ